MSNWSQDLNRYLQTDPRDAGCDTAMHLLHVYAELAAADPAAARRRYPDVAAHLRSCGPCEQDLDGLLAAIKASSRGVTPQGLGTFIRQADAFGPRSS